MGLVLAQVPLGGYGLYQWSLTQIVKRFDEGWTYMGRLNRLLHEPVWAVNMGLDLVEREASKDPRGRKGVTPKNTINTRLVY